VCNYYFFGNCTMLVSKPTSSSSRLNFLRDVCTIHYQQFVKLPPTTLQTSSSTIHNMIPLVEKLSTTYRPYYLASKYVILLYYMAYYVAVYFIIKSGGRTFSVLEINLLLPPLLCDATLIHTATATTAN